MTRYDGNTVSEIIGGINYSRHVWVDVTDDGSNTGTQTNVHYTYGWYFNRFFDGSWNPIYVSDPWGSANLGTKSCPGAGDHVLHGPYTNAAPIQYGGGTSIHFSLSAKDAYGTSVSRVDFDYALPARSGGEAPPPTPPDPPGLYYSNLWATNVTVALSAPANNNGAAVTAYEIHLLSNNAWPDSGGHDVAAAADWRVNASGLTPATRYYYTGRAWNSAGWSAWAAMGTIDTPPTTPDAPGTSADTIAQTTARIVVTAPGYNGGSGIEVYEAYVLTNNAWPGSGGNVVTSWQGGTAVAGGLTPGTTYYYTSRAHNVAGWSAWTAMKVFTTLPGVHLRVSGAWVNAKPHNRISGAWVSSRTHGRVSGAWS